MKIAVLGGGNGAYAAAADLSEQGHEVRLWRRDADALQATISHGTITLKDSQGARDVAIALATGNIASALQEAQLIVVPTPANAQDDIALAMAPHLRSGQVVFLPPGSFGGYAMAQIVKRAGCNADVLWAETGTLPYLARKHGDRTQNFAINITVRAIHLPTGVYPECRSKEALQIIRQAYPAAHDCGNILSGALMNAGPIIHPPLMIMNAAPLQHFEKWDIHNEGTQPSVRAVTDQLDQERIAIREALGFRAPHYPLADHYNTNKWMYGDAHKKLVKSGDWREAIDLKTHRYVTEDIEIGLAFLASVARWAQVDAPITQGILAITSGILGRDLRQGARTLESLGLATLTRERLSELLLNGT